MFRGLSTRWFCLVCSRVGWGLFLGVFLGGEVSYLLGLPLTLVVRAGLCSDVYYHVALMVWVDTTFGCVNVNRCFYIWRLSSRLGGVVTAFGMRIVEQKRVLVRCFN